MQIEISWDKGEVKAEDGKFSDLVEKQRSCRSQRWGEAHLEMAVLRVKYCRARTLKRQSSEESSLEFLVYY